MDLLWEWAKRCTLNQTLFWWRDLVPRTILGNTHPHPIYWVYIQVIALSMTAVSGKKKIKSQNLLTDWQHISFTLSLYLNVSRVRTLNNVIWIWIMPVTELQLFLSIWQMGMVGVLLATTVPLKVTQMRRPDFFALMTLVLAIISRIQWISTIYYSFDGIWR